MLRLEFRLGYTPSLNTAASSRYIVEIAYYTPALHPFLTIIFANTLPNYTKSYNVTDGWTPLISGANKNRVLRLISQSESRLKNS